MSSRSTFLLPTSQFAAAQPQAASVPSRKVASVIDIDLRRKGYLRLATVLPLTGMSRSSFLAMIAAGRAPAPYKLGARAVGFNFGEIEDWLASFTKA